MWMKKKVKEELHDARMRIIMYSEDFPNSREREKAMIEKELCERLLE